MSEMMAISTSSKRYFLCRLAMQHPAQLVNPCKIPGRFDCCFSALSSSWCETNFVSYTLSPPPVDLYRWYRFFLVMMKWAFEISRHQLQYWTTASLRFWICFAVLTRQSNDIKVIFIYRNPMIWVGRYVRMTYGNAFAHFGGMGIQTSIDTWFLHESSMYNESNDSQTAIHPVRSCLPLPQSSMDQNTK